MNIHPLRHAFRLSALLVLTFSLLHFIPGRSQSVTYAQPVETDHVVAELVSEVTSIQPGTPFWVALRLEMEEHWHTYWENPGDAGMVTHIEWELPDGFETGEIHWPHPEWIEVPPIVSYGYEGEIFLLVEMTPPADLPAGTTVTLAAHSDWLVCKEICLPGEAYVTLSLPVSSAEAEIDDRWAAGFRESRDRFPADMPDTWIARAEEFEGNVYLTVDLPQEVRRSLNQARFFALTPAVINHSAAQTFQGAARSFQVVLQKSSFASGDAGHLAGVVVSPGGWPDRSLPAAVRIEAPLVQVEAVPTLPAAGSSAGTTLAWALLFALIGGLILNLMPCVFPVISLKVLNFVQISGEAPQKMRAHGLLFAAGVVVSFLVLAGVLIALRAGGEELGWGFQLQTPGFIVLMSLLLFGIALNLMGVFEIGLSVMGLAGRLGHSSSYSGSFAAGVLATVLATPCTAPFMGVALGFALTQPVTNSLLIFAALGSGMALPYVLFSFAPRLLRMLPKPGPWMETFKQAMAFPLFATVIWLIWVFGRQVGIDGVLLLLIGLMGVAIAAWIIGRWSAQAVSLRARVATRAIALAVFALALYVSFSGASIAPRAAYAEGPQTDRFGITWEPFSTEQVGAWRAEGEIVFIDFTAAWCLTCKVNEQVVFSSSRVRERVNEMEIRMVKADWTSRDPEITRALQRYGRSGVPLYVLYYGGSDTPPIILPEVLNTTIFLQALDRAS